MITKSEWETIEKEMSGSYGSVKFELGDKEITLEKRFIKENQLAICVFIDGTMMQSMGFPGENFDPIVEQLWNKRSRAYYTTKQKQEWTKLFGKRRVKKELPKFDEKMEWYSPIFKTVASLKRTYKRIDGLAFVESQYLSSTDPTSL